MKLTPNLFLHIPVSDETAKLEDLRDKNISLKDELRNMTAKLEVIYRCMYFWMP